MCAGGRSVRRDAVAHVERRQHRRRRLAEVEHHPVAQPFDGLPAVRDGDPLDEARDPGGEIGRLLVAALLGQPAVARDVEEADRRRTLETRVQTGPDQDALEPFEDVAHPGVRLLAVEERRASPRR